jgi:hypothetical protein
MMAGEEKLPDGCAPAFFGAVVGLIVGVSLCGLAIGNKLEERDQLRAEAIEKGYAEHNPKTGVWEWKEKP